MTAIGADMALVAIDRRRALESEGSVRAALAAAALQRPAAVPVFLAQLRLPVRPILGNAAGLQVFLLGFGVALARSLIRDASIIWPPLAR